MMSLRNQIFRGIRVRPPGEPKTASAFVGALLAAFMAVMFVNASPARAGGMEEAFSAALAAFAPQGWSAQLEVVTDPAVTIAMIATYESRHCRISVLKTSAYLVDTLQQLGPAVRRPYMEALFAHELGHCEDSYVAQYEAGSISTDSGSLSALTAQSTVEGATQLSAAPRRVLWREILADAYLALYLHDRYPDVAPALVAFHLGRRAGRARADPEHDTSMYLAGQPWRRDTGESLYEAAIRIRSIGTDRAY